MQTVNRLLTNICSDDLLESKSFYTELFDFDVDYDSDWFVHLISKNKSLELGIIARTSDVIPPDYQLRPQGFYVTFVVDSVDALFEKVKAEDYDVVSEPTDTAYGQRRLLLKDPDGTLVDVSSPIPGFQF